MALIKCPECGKEVSDKASVCIHCGYPLSDINKHSNVTTSNNSVIIEDEKLNEELLELTDALFLSIDGKVKELERICLEGNKVVDYYMRYEITHKEYQYKNFILQDSNFINLQNALANNRKPSFHLLVANKLLDMIIKFAPMYNCPSFGDIYNTFKIVDFSIFDDNSFDAFSNSICEYLFSKPSKNDVFILDEYNKYLEPIDNITYVAYPIYASLLYGGEKHNNRLLSVLNQPVSEDIRKRYKPKVVNNFDRIYREMVLFGKKYISPSSKVFNLNLTGEYGHDYFSQKPIITSQNSENNPKVEQQKDSVVRCPNCGSTSIQTMQRGYHDFFGWSGSSQIVNVCQACGYKFSPGNK